MEEEDRVLLAGIAEDGYHVLTAFPGPAALPLAVAHLQRPLAQRPGHRLRTDRLARAGRAREVEGQPNTGIVAFAQPPVLKNEAVLLDLHQRLVERLARVLRQNHVREGAARRDQLDQTSSSPPVQWLFPHPRFLRRRKRNTARS